MKFLGLILCAAMVVVSLPALLLANEPTRAVVTACARTTD